MFGEKNNVFILIKYKVIVVRKKNVVSGVK